MASRTLRTDVATALQVVTFPTDKNYMDVIRAVGSMPLPKLHLIYEQLFGEKPEVLDAQGAIVLSPNRKQLVRLGQYGVQLAFYGSIEALPEKAKQATLDALDEELVAESAKAVTVKTRGPTIKALVLAMLAGTPGTYVDPKDGQTKEGNIVPVDDEIYKAVQEKFPGAAFDKTHLAWYLARYRKGTFEKAGYGGATGKPMGVLMRDINRETKRATSAAEREKAAAQRAADKAARDAAKPPKAGKVPEGVVAPAGAAATSNPAGDALSEFADAAEPPK